MINTLGWQDYRFGMVLVLIGRCYLQQYKYKYNIKYINTNMWGWLSTCKHYVTVTSIIMYLPSTSSISWVSFPMVVGIVFSNLLLSIATHRYNIESDMINDGVHMNLIWHKHEQEKYLQIFSTFSWWVFPISLGIIPERRLSSEQRNV